MKRIILLFALVSFACGSSAPTSPTAAPIAIAPVTTLPVPLPDIVTTVLLAGQSNAVQIRSSLEAAYPHLDGYAYGGTEIGQWLTDTPWTWVTFGFSPWTNLRPVLQKYQQEPLRAFVWWQGESDASDPYRPDPALYRAKLAQFFANVRSETGQADLFLVVCQILPATTNDTTLIRQQIADYVASDAHSRLVMADDLPRMDAEHLTRDGYDVMAKRIVAALP